MRRTFFYLRLPKEKERKEEGDGKGKERERERERRGERKGENNLTLQSPPIPETTDSRLVDLLTRILEKDPAKRIKMLELRVRLHAHAHAHTPLRDGFSLCS